MGRMVTETDEKIERGRKALGHLEDNVPAESLDPLLEAFSILGVKARPTELLALWHGAREEAGDDDWKFRRRLEGTLLARAGLFATRDGSVQPLEPPGRLLHAFIRCEHDRFDQRTYLEIAKSQLGALPDPPHHIYGQYYLGDEWDDERARWSEDEATAWIESLARRGVIPGYDLARCDVVVRTAEDPIEEKGVLFAALRVRGPAEGDWRPFHPAPEEALESYRVLCECGKHIRIRESFAGRRGKCPKCQKKFACLDIGKLPAVLDHAIILPQASRDAAKKSLETLIEVATERAPGPACVARYSHSPSQRRLLALKKSDPEAFEVRWNSLPARVREGSADAERIAILVRGEDRPAWLERIAPRKKDVAGGGKQTDLPLSVWRENGFDRAYQLVDYSLVALGEEAGGALSTEDRTFFKLPEGIFFGFSALREDDARKWFDAARETATRKCKRTVYLTLLEGSGRWIVGITGRAGSLAAFRTAHAPAAAKAPAPEWSAANVADLEGWRMDEEFYEDVKNGILGGEFRLVDRYSLKSTTK